MHNPNFPNMQMVLLLTVYVPPLLWSYLSCIPSQVPLDPSWLSHCHTCHITPDPSQPVAPIQASYDHLWAPITTHLLFSHCICSLWLGVHLSTDPSTILACASLTMSHSRGCESASDQTPFICSPRNESKKLVMFQDWQIVARKVSAKTSPFGSRWALHRDHAFTSSCSMVEAHAASPHY